MSDEKTQNTHTRTLDPEDDRSSGAFERYAYLDRPFLTQSPGFHEDDPFALAADAAGALQMRRDAERPNQSVNDIVALLKTDHKNRHFETGGSVGLRKPREKRVRPRIAGEPLSGD